MNTEARQIAETAKSLVGLETTVPVYLIDSGGAGEQENQSLARLKELGGAYLALEARCGRMAQALEWYATADVGEYVAEGEGAKARAALTDGGRG